MGKSPCLSARVRCTGCYEKQSRCWETVGKQLPSLWKSFSPARERLRPFFNKYLYQGGAFSGTWESGQEVVTLAGEGVARDPLAPGHPGSTHMSCLLCGKPSLGPPGGQQGHGRQAPHQQDIRVIRSLRKSFSRQRTDSVADSASSELLDSPTR